MKAKISDSIKYAIMTVNKKTILDAPYAFDGNTYVTPKTLQDFALDDNERTKHWRDWLGSLRWDEINRSGLLFVTWQPTERPEILDAENIELEARVTRAWLSMLVSHTKSPHWSESANIKISGSGRLVDGQVVPTDIRSYSTKPILTRPLYDRSREFRDAFPFPWKDLYWLDEWKANYAIMGNILEQKRIYAAFADLLESLISARTTNNATTNIARMVEATEAIVALPQRNGGRDAYADRCYKLITRNCASDPYLKWTADQFKQNLVRVYKIRINRNHGKGMNDHLPDVIGEPAIPAKGKASAKPHEPESDPEKIDLALERLTYLAELVAKEAINYVLKDLSKFDLLKSRPELEAAWHAGSFVG